MGNRLSNKKNITFSLLFSFPFIILLIKLPITLTITISNHGNSMNKKAIKLEDIAVLLNVTKVTVSKALRNHPDISEQMTKKVKKTAEELGYYPNRLASNLSSKKSNTIGVVVPKIAHYFFSSIIESVYDTVFEKNYEATLMVSQENEERQKKHLESLISMHVDGIIISISQETKDYSIFETIKSRNIPLVFFDRVLENSGFSCISVNDRKGSFELIDYSIKSGYKNIAHLAGPLNINIGLERLIGYKEAHEKNGLPLDEKNIIFGGFGEKEGYNGFMYLYNQGPLPELIYAVTFPVALGAIQAAKKCGVKIPGDTNIICFGRSDYNGIINPSVSCAVQPTQELGKRAVEILLEEIQNPDKTIKQNIKLDTSLEIFDNFNR
jgi:LacI family transcriptional regulator